jgi:hypothetical protein
MNEIEQEETVEDAKIKTLLDTLSLDQFGVNGLQMNNDDDELNAERMRNERNEGILPAQNYIHKVYKVQETNRPQQISIQKKPG